MCAAHSRGDVAAIRELLEKYPALEKMGPDDNHIPWLHWAAQHGQTGVVEFWLQRGWDVNLSMGGNSRTDGIYTALHAAKDAATTRYLLSQGADVNACCRGPGTPLHQAVVRAVEPSQKGRRRSEGADIEQIRALVEAGADMSLTNDEEKGGTPLASAIALRRKTAEQFLRDAGAPEVGRSLFASRRKRTKMDLKADFERVYKYLAKCVRKFDPAKHEGLGGPGPVRLIHLGFDHIHSGWAVAVFDTRPDADNDGEWTSEIEGNELKLPHWRQVTETNTEQPTTLILTDGSQSVLPENTELAVPLGEMLKAVVLKARADGLFAKLEQAPGCELIVDHFDGVYGWPEPEARGIENLAALQ